MGCRGAMIVGSLAGSSSCSGRAALARCAARVSPEGCLPVSNFWARRQRDPGRARGDETWEALQRGSLAVRGYPSPPPRGRGEDLATHRDERTGFSDAPGRLSRSNALAPVLVIARSVSDAAIHGVSSGLTRRAARAEVSGHRLPRRLRRLAMTRGGGVLAQATKCTCSDPCRPRDRRAVRGRRRRRQSPSRPHVPRPRS
jgi:hypothetical protein